MKPLAAFAAGSLVVAVVAAIEVRFELDAQGARFQAQIAEIEAHSCPMDQRLVADLDGEAIYFGRLVAARRPCWVTVGKPE